MIDVVADVNFFLDAVRFRDGFEDAADRPQDRFSVLRSMFRRGPKVGVILHTGPHVLSNVRRALRSEEVSERGGVTRSAWTNRDIELFVQFIVGVVAATGGRSDIVTISHDRGHRLAEIHGAPDSEDMQMLFLAVNSPATVLATGDAELLAMGEFRSVELWRSSEVDAEVRANIRRADREALVAA